jgi:hypothetical protein
MESTTENTESTEGKQKNQRFDALILNIFSFSKTQEMKI